MVVIIGMVATMVMFTGCTDKYIPATPVAPVCEDATYACGYTGEVSGTTHYKVIILDDINTQFVCDALQYVPGWYDFEIVSPDSSLYMVETKGIHTGAPIPMQDNLIVVFDAEKRGVTTWAGLAYFGGSAHWKNRVCIAVFDMDDRLTIGARIYHEVLHCTGQNGDADEMDTCIDYRAYTGHTTLNQERYYMYLLAKYRGDLI